MMRPGAVSGATRLLRSVSALEQPTQGDGVVSDQSHAWCEILSVVRMLRRVLCGHWVVDVGRAVRVLFNRTAERRERLSKSPERANASTTRHTVRDAPTTARPPERAVRSAPSRHPFPSEQHPRARPEHVGDLGGVAAPGDSSEAQEQRARPRVRHAWEQCAQGLWSGDSMQIGAATRVWASM